VVFISFLLLITSSSSNNDGLSTSTNIKARPTGNREISKALAHLRSNPAVKDDLPGTEDDLHQYAEERENALLSLVDGVDKILGYASRISFLVNLVGSFVKEAPKYTIDDVMDQLNTQFADVKNQLSVIYNKMQKQDIDAYHAVEDAVTAANTDIQFNNTLELNSRALNLYDQLNVFSRGMLGQNSLSGDILQVTSDLLKVILKLLNIVRILFIYEYIFTFYLVSEH